jgi:hypothetical protein
VGTKIRPDNENVTQRWITTYPIVPPIVYMLQCHITHGMLEVRNWSNVFQSFIASYWYRESDHKTLNPSKLDEKRSNWTIFLTAPINVVLKPSPSFTTTVTNVMEMFKARSVFWELQPVALNAFRIQAEDWVPKEIPTLILFVLNLILSWKNTLHSWVAKVRAIFLPDERLWACQEGPRFMKIV